MKPLHCLSMKSLRELRAQIQAEYDRKLATLDAAIAIEEQFEAGQNQQGNNDINQNIPPSYLSIENIESVILGISGEFSAKDVEPAIYRAYPSQKVFFKENLISAALYRLIKAGMLKYVHERAGRRPATYIKV